MMVDGQFKNGMQLSYLEFLDLLLERSNHVLLLLQLATEGVDLLVLPESIEEGGYY